MSKPDPLVRAVRMMLDEAVTVNEPELLDLKNTPRRVAKMYRKELLSSYEFNSEVALREKFTTFPSQGNHEMVTESNIQFYSLCAHHMLPFFGKAHVGYIPHNEIVGLSKIPRVVEYFSRALQTQERFTSQVADFLNTELDAAGVIVITEARHLCMEMRGIEKPETVTRVSAIRGRARDPVVRDEFYRLISLGK